MKYWCRAMTVWDSTTDILFDWYVRFPGFELHLSIEQTSKAGFLKWKDIFEM